MDKNKKIAIGAGIAGGAALLLWALSRKSAEGSGPPPPPPPPEGLANLYGRVTDPSGAPIAGASVVLYLTSYTTSTDDSGSYQFTDVEPGAYTVGFRKDVANVPLYEPLDKAITLVEGNNELNVQMTPITAQLAGLYGTVIDESGIPLSGVRVHAFSQETGGQATYTDASGNYQFANLGVGYLSHGIYMVTFSKEGYYDVVRQVTLVAGQDYLLDVEMSAMSVPPPPPPTGLYIPVGEGILDIKSVNGYPFAEVGQFTQEIVSPFTGGPPQVVTLPYGKLANPIPASQIGRITLMFRNNTLIFSGHSPHVASLILGMYAYPDPEAPHGYQYLAGTSPSWTPLENLQQTVYPPFDAEMGLDYGPLWADNPPGVYNGLFRIWALAWDGNFIVGTFWIRNMVDVR